MSEIMETWDRQYVGKIEALHLCDVYTSSLNEHTIGATTDGKKKGASEYKTQCACKWTRSRISQFNTLTSSIFNDDFR